MEGRIAKLPNMSEKIKAENKPGKCVSFSAKPQKNIPAIIIAVSPAKLASKAAIRSTGRPLAIGLGGSAVWVTEISGSDSMTYTCRGQYDLAN
jgi:hypothetical protein